MGPNSPSILPRLVSSCCELVCALYVRYIASRAHRLALYLNLLSRLLSAISKITMRFLRLLGLAGAAVAACNGQEAYCDRKYSDITVVGSHNSAFVGTLPMHNQFVSVTRQLDLGVRFLQAQTHKKDGEIELCHKFCWELDVGPLTDYLREIADWLAGHPNEVVTLLLTNSDGMPVTQYDEDFETGELRDYVFRPEGNLTKEEWPTLQEMIDDGTQLVVFMGKCSTRYAHHPCTKRHRQTTTPT